MTRGVARVRVARRARAANGDGASHDVAEGAFDARAAGADELAVDLFERGHGEEAASAARREDEARAFLRMETHSCYNEE